MENPPGETGADGGGTGGVNDGCPSGADGEGTGGQAMDHVPREAAITTLRIMTSFVWQSTTSL